MSQEIGTVSLQEALETFLFDAMARRLAPSTIDYYRVKLGYFIAWAESHGVELMGEVTPRLVRAYLAHLSETGHNAGGVHNVARALRAWMNFLVLDGILEASPFQRVRMPKAPEPSPVNFTPEEVRAMLKETLHLRDEALILFLLDTGARVGELVALNVADVDMATGAVRIAHGKGDKARTVFLGYRSRRVLRRYLREREDEVTPNSPLFTSLRSPREGRRMTTQAVRLLMSRLCRRAGIPVRGPHALRRTFALWALRSGMDVYTLAKLMGHSDISTLRHYLRFIEDDLREAHRRHSPVNGYLSKEKNA